MATISSTESINTEREKANLLSLIKLTLNTLLDQSSSVFSLPVLDDRDADVTNFIITLERILCFRLKANWLSDRRYFWDFIRPACIGSCRQTIIERVEDVSKARSLKEKGRTWIKFALMEKKLSELLKLVISDCHLVRKFYHDDSIMSSSQAFILCDQLAGLSAIDFSFCFKQDGLINTPTLANDADIDVIDLTSFLSYKSKQIKHFLRDQREDEENKQPAQTLTAMNEMKPIHSPERETISLEKYKLEVEQRKYFEDLLRQRDRELQQVQIRYDTLKGERESEIIQMESIILELQLELRAARDELEVKRKKLLQPGATTPPKASGNPRKADSPTTPTNDRPGDGDKGPKFTLVNLTVNATRDNTSSVPDESLPLHVEHLDQNCSQTSSRSSHSTTTTNTDDDQYELVRKLPSNINDQGNPTGIETKPTSSPEMLSSAASLASASSSSDDDDQQQQQQQRSTAETSLDDKTSTIDESQ